MRREQLERENLAERYIDFSSICQDYDLTEGGLAPEQLIKLEDILIQFIIQNKY